MSYERLNLADGVVLKAEHLSHFEDGIEANATSIGEIETALDNIIAIQESLIGGAGE